MVLVLSRPLAFGMQTQDVFNRGVRANNREGVCEESVPQGINLTQPSVVTTMRGKAKEKI
jgi:hypothetical protein